MPPKRSRAASNAQPPPSRSRAAARADGQVDDQPPAAKRVLRAAPSNVDVSKPDPAADAKAPKAPAKSKSFTSEKPKPDNPKTEKPKLKAERSRTSDKGKAPARPRKVAQALNALPAAPQHYRPPLQLFSWGSGEMAQLAMDYNMEITKPRKNAFVAEGIADGIFGGDEAGLEAIAAGGLHTLFVDEKGTVWSCGTNDLGALGRVTVNMPDPKNDQMAIEVDEKTQEPVWKPVPVHTLVEEGFRAVQIVAGDNFSVAINDKGELRAWGSFRGNEGIVGFSSSSQRQYTPVPVLELKDEKWVSAASGNNHLILLTDMGNIYTMGTGEEGQLGRRVIERRKIAGTTPEKIHLGTRSRKAVLVGAGNNHSFAVDEEGDVWGWGVNSYGQTGTGLADKNINKEVHAPTRVHGLGKVDLGGATVVQIAGGDFHTLFRSSDGRVYACGMSAEGRLGLAANDPALQDRQWDDCVPEPVRVTFSDANDPVVHVACGTNNNLAVTRSGALLTWGRQVVGELGLGWDEGDPNEQLTPEVVVRKEGGSWTAVDASCGGQHCLALLRNKATPAIPVVADRPGR
ncbi:RCC1/BLIP-II [Epithele typhae]|uniref:RCC1/BLIP-II n=1 Tax=Epithele typhae TaxID=378194 RepID=UPI002007A865|nr:RCC1/BLIP-II [Epithele typhae]KAH9928515.1 RCC1/BLIP-II [Epithele typhae]